MEKRNNFLMLTIIAFMVLTVSVKAQPQKTTLRNPFAAPSVVIKKPEIKITKNPLQRYDVKSFTLKGVVATSQGNLALVVAPDGNIYIVKEGMYMGNKGEIIEKITLNTIVLKRGSRTITLTMAEKEGSKR